MEFKEFVKEYNRMCNFHRNCIDCPIDKEADNRGLSELKCGCGVVDFLLDIDAESIVENWVKRHPVKTYESDFKEKVDKLLNLFPNHEIKKFVKDADVSIYDTLCVADFYFNGDYEEAGCDCDVFDRVRCERCWKREIEDE